MSRRRGLSNKRIEKRRRRNRRLCRLEPLEQRKLLAADIGVQNESTILVDLAEDELDGDHSPGDVSLREAIELARELPDANILFDDKLDGIPLLLSLRGPDENGNQTGDLDLLGTFSLIGNGRDKTIIDGSGLGDRILDVHGQSDITISGLTLRGGNAAIGGGIFNAGNVTLTGSTIAGNTAAQEGGGLWNDAGGTMTITGGTVAGNTAAQEGGGLWNDAGGTLTITGTTIDGNTAGGAQSDSQGGGGIFNNGGNVSIDNSDVIGNTASGDSASGGGLFTLGGSLDITGGSITGNTADRAGGGIELGGQEGGGFVNLTDVSISDNTADVNGGGLHVTNPETTLRITRGSLTGNTASGRGGGIWNGSGTLTIDGTTIDGNTANREGGGLWNDARGTMTITGTTIDGNTAGGAQSDSQGGGGIFNDGGTVSISNSDVIGNTASGDSASGGGLFTRGGSLEITGGSITGNTADRAGGGIEIGGQGAGAPFTLTDVSISSNTADVNGGGLHVTNPEARLRVSGGSLTGNTASGRGGGIWNGSGTATIDGVTIDGNTASGEGGGLWNDGGTMTITGTTIDGNTAGSAESDSQGGGGIFNNGGTLNISRTTLTGNTADGRNGSGGGIFNHGGSIDFTNASITSNSASRAGGGIEIRSGNLSGGSTYLGDVELQGNTADFGGGLHITSGPAVESPIVNIVDSDFDGNRAHQEGGGLWNSSRAQITISDSVITGNSAGSAESEGQGGGGIFNNGGTLTINASSIVDNTADGRATAGGGIFHSAGQLSVQDSTVARNIAPVGGGIQFQDAFGTIVNSTLSNNQSVATVLPGAGGIVVATTPNGSTTSLGINHSTIVENVGAGGNVQVISLGLLSPFLNIENSIVASATNGPNFLVGGTGPTPIIQSLGHNLSDDNSGPLFGPGDMINTEPLLEPLADNGGTTQTHALMSESPAIDAGALPGGIGALLFDQRGLPFLRAVDGDGDDSQLPDIGAFERQSIDFGDAPDSYRTTVLSGGPSHSAFGPRLGDRRDGELDGVPTPGADGDDLNGDDEDGVRFGRIVVSESMAGVNIDLQNAATARVDAWLDFAGDGTFDAEDQILKDQVVTNVAGFQTLNFNIDASAVVGETIARVRVSTLGGLDSGGAAADGEVEDYVVRIVARPAVEKVDVNGGIDSRSQLTGIEVRFDDQVSTPVEAFRLIHQETNEPVESLEVEATLNPDGTTSALLTFGDGPLVISRESGNSLVNGNYLLSIDRTQIVSEDTGLAMEQDFTFGNEATDNFFRFFGDDDGDRDTDGLDYIGFTRTFLRSRGDASFNSQYDGDGDGDVDGLDYTEFANAFLRTLAPPN